MAAAARCEVVELDGDKPAAEADTLEAVLRLVAAGEQAA